LSGVLTLPNPHDAFASRILLAQTAEQTLDVQYYIWHDDMTGILMLKALSDAADRGVHVRLLLDDNGIAGMDWNLAALNVHKNIEIRVFNPFKIRTPRWLGYLFDFKRINRRMHNKSFTADDQVTIVGGRNIGNEYFGAGTGTLFADLDVLLIGPVVKQISNDFEKYWASTSAVAIEEILPESGEDDFNRLREKMIEAEQSTDAFNYIKAIRDTDFVTQLTEGNLNLEWADIRLISDDPAKALGKSNPGDYLTAQIEKSIGKPKAEVILVSSYFVPTEAGEQLFTELAKRGIEVHILTNSLAATDVKVVHAGYIKRRKSLVKAGIKLYELRRQGTDTEFNELAGPFGSSGSSLHAKTFSVDRKRVFVGSFNFDPRSANLNTEMGVVIESPNLAGEIRDVFDKSVTDNAYEVKLDSKGKLIWIDYQNGNQTIHYKEPETGLLQRKLIYFLSKLPIEWML
jgi:cardiolipin synthase C